MSEETTEETIKPDLVDLLKNLPNAPDQPTIDTWKAKYKNIFVSGFAEDELYIFRGITRLEYKKMQIDQQVSTALLQQKTQGAETLSKEEIQIQISAGIENQFSMEENIVSTCLLWPKLTAEELQNKAGTVPALLEQIMTNSNFLTPAQASMLVIKL